MTVDDVYENFINSAEYNVIESSREDIELDWIHTYLDHEKFLLLEQEISRYVIKNDRAMFCYGFNSAYELLKKI